MSSTGGKTLSSTVMNLKFMQRNAGNKPSIDKSTPTYHSPLTTATATTASSEASTSRTKIIIETSYASFPLLLAKSTSKQESNASQMSTGRTSYGSQADKHDSKDNKEDVKRKDVSSNRKKKHTKNEKMQIDSHVDASEDSNDDSSDAQVSQQLTSTQKKPMTGFQKPGGFEDVKPSKSQLQEAIKVDEDFVDDMIEGARAKRSIKKEHESNEHRKKKKKHKSA